MNRNTWLTFAIVLNTLLFADNRSASATDGDSVKKEIAASNARFCAELAKGDA